jgi:benzoyl-CoA reductase/2-hydroxyglutaryl-CoA dehydratase subunit BcrC/BadD/HgdB
MVHKNIKPLYAMQECGETMLSLVEGAIAKQEMKVLRSFFKGLNSIVQKDIDAVNNGSPILGTHFAFPSELFYCFDCVPLCFETLSYLNSAIVSEGSEPFYDIANNFGHPYHSCSSQKGVMGMTLMKDFFDADIIAIPSSPCDNTVASYQFFSEYKKIPMIVADMPYYHDERGYKYYANQLKLMVEKISKVLNQKPDYERLRRAVGYSSEAVKYQTEINDLRAMIPCPIESMFNPMGSCVQNFFAGRPEKAQFYKDIAELARDRVKRKVKGAGLEEKIRSYWPYMSIFFSIEFCEWMDRHLGMSVVSDVFNHFFFEPIDKNAELDNIFLGLAKQSMEYPMVRQSATFADNFLDDSVFLAKKFNVECAIFTAHIGCKQSLSVIQLIRDVLRNELGIPMLTLELDIGDKRYSSIESIKKKVQDFTETLL